jgi:hypothetical protein
MTKTMWADFDNKSFFLQLSDTTFDYARDIMKTEDWVLFCDSLDGKTFVLKKKFSSLQDAKSYAEQNDVEFSE